MPVLFFYTSTGTGAMIRELLGMQDPKGPYYDPAGKGKSPQIHRHHGLTLRTTSKINCFFFNLYVSFFLIDHTHKRITLLPDKLTEESKVVLKNLLSRRNLLEELNSKEANDILIRASPKDVRSMTQC